MLKAEKDAFLVTQMLLKEVWNRAVWPTGALQTQSQTGSSETKRFRVGVKDPLGQWEGKIRPGFVLIERGWELLRVTMHSVCRAVPTVLSAPATGGLCKTQLQPEKRDVQGGDLSPSAMPAHSPLRAGSP